jgi:hypothetical protein
VKLLDVTGNGEYLINLDHVRHIKLEAAEGSLGEKATITFIFGNGDENIFGISSRPLAVIDDLLLDLVVTAA